MRRATAAVARLSNHHRRSVSNSRSSSRIPALEKQTIDGALARGDPKLVALAQDWLRDTGQAVPAVVALARHAARGAAAAARTPDAPKPARYLRGVR